MDAKKTCQHSGCQRKAQSGYKFCWVHKSDVKHELMEKGYLESKGRGN